MDQNKESESKEDKISLCDIMKEDTSEVIKKLESQVPSFTQGYLDLYTAYLHMLDDIFGTCYISEKQFFDRLDIDQGVLKQIKKNSELIKKNYLEHIDMTSRFFDEYNKARISAIKSYDNYIHVMMESYAKMLEGFNKAKKSSQ